MVKALLTSHARLLAAVIPPHLSFGDASELLARSITVKFIMRSDQRRQQFPSFQGDDEEEEIFETLQRLLIKDSGVRWTSTY